MWLHADEVLVDAGALDRRALLPLQHVGQIDLATLHYHVDHAVLRLDLRVDLSEEVPAVMSKARRDTEYIRDLGPPAR